MILITGGNRAIINKERKSKAEAQTSVSDQMIINFGFGYKPKVEYYKAWNVIKKESLNSEVLFCISKNNLWGWRVRAGAAREGEMSYLLPHLHSGWAVDQAILAEEERLVVIRFGHDWDETCMQVYLYLYFSLIKTSKI